MDDAPFDVIMQQAAKLKTEQLAVNRRKYDSFPMWYQHSLFSVDKIIHARDTMEFEELYQYGLDLKDLGNRQFRAGNMLGAMNEYEKAISLFKWLRPLRDDWKKRGIDDKEMEECVYAPKSDHEKVLIAKLNCQCLVNIAMCTQRTKEWAVSISACDAVLNTVDCKCAKALYRRAQARSIPLSCGATENYAALRDMKAALQCLREEKQAREETGLAAQEPIEDENASGVRVFNSNSLLEDVGSVYNTVLADYKKLSGELRQLEAKDRKRNTKLFKGEVRPETVGIPSTGSRSLVETEETEESNRGGSLYHSASEEEDDVPTVEEYNSHPSTAGNDTGKVSDEKSRLSRTDSGNRRTAKKTPVTPLDDLTMKDVEVSIRDMEAAAKRYETDRQFAKAREVRARVSKMQQILHTHEVEVKKKKRNSTPDGSEGPETRDFFNPTPEMVEEAQRLHGLDLTDRRVQEMLHDLQHQHKNGPSTSTSGVESPTSESLLQAMRVSEYKRIAEKFLEDYTTRSALMTIALNRHYNGLNTGFNRDARVHLGDGGDSKESAHAYCTRLLVEDWQFLVSAEGAGNKGETMQIEGKEASLLDGVQLEKVLMLYMPWPSLTAEMTLNALGLGSGSISCGSGIELRAYHRRVLFYHVMRFLSTGTTPYVIGFVITLGMMFGFAQYRFMSRKYSESVDMYAGPSAEPFSQQYSYDDL